MHRRSTLVPALAAVFLFAGLAAGQTVSIVSGNGQLSCGFCASFIFDPLVVVVKDANGNPLSGTAVTWTVTSGPGTVGSSQTITQADGTASIAFTQGPPANTVGQVPYNQSIVSASTGSSTVQFVETTAAAGGSGLPSSAQAAFNAPLPGSTLSGASGQQTEQPLQVQVVANNNVPIPGVLVQLVPAQAGGPALVCAAGPNTFQGGVLTDTTGTAKCTLIFAGSLGTGKVTPTVGGKFASFLPINVTVTTGPPDHFKVISGNNQSANPGAGLPAPLSVEVDDLSGNPVPNAQVTWTVTGGAATFSNTRTTTDTQGRVSTNVTLGTGTGPVTVQVALVSNPAVTATFTATPNIVLTGIQKLSGDEQSAVIATDFANPLVVQVNGSSGPLAGVAVQFAVINGIATVNTPTATTNDQGQASTTVLAGNAAGPVTINATVGSFSTVFNLTVRPPGPTLTSDSFVNAAGFQKGSLSPCSLVTIMGKGLATGIQGAVVPRMLGPLPLEVANLTVQFGGSYAPIYSVVNMDGQESVTVQVPCDVTPGTVSVGVRLGTETTTVDVPVQPLSPGLFETTESDGVERAVLVRPDGSFVSRENPAHRGEVIRLYATGLGQTNPGLGTNQVGVLDADQEVTAPVVVGVNNGGVRVVSARYAQNLIGVYEVAFEVPSDTATGDNIPFVVALIQGDSLLFSNPSLIPIQ